MKVRRDEKTVKKEGIARRLLEGTAASEIMAEEQVPWAVWFKEKRTAGVEVD